MAEVRRKRKRRCHKVKRGKRVGGKRKLRRCRPRRRRPVLAPGGTHPPAPVVAPLAGAEPPPAAPAPPAPRFATIVSPIGVYAGPFGRAQAERLLWRAGFGPRPGQVEALAAIDLEAAVTSLTRPTGEAPMDGPEPTVDGQPLDVLETWYGDTLYWFDRCVRSRHQLVERLALVLHDWWATSNDAVGSSRFVLDQTNLFRTYGLGSFAELVRAVTTGPAMLAFLDGIYEGPRMTKPPVVFAAGLLRARERPIDDERWVWLADGAGQRLYYPPDVSGWDDERWLDTNTVRARWDIVNEVMRGQSITSATWDGYPAETPDEAVAKARAFWLDPSLTDETVASLREFSPTSISPTASASLRAQRQNALRQLIAASPDYQTC